MSEHKNDNEIDSSIDLLEEFESQSELPEREALHEEPENLVPDEVQEEKLDEEISFDSPEQPLEEEPIPEDTGAAKRLAEELLKVAPDVPVTVLAVMGKVSSNVSELISLKQGSVINLKRPPNETLDLVANGKLIARGELVEMDGNLGVRVVKLVR